MLSLSLSHSVSLFLSLTHSTLSLLLSISPSSMLLDCKELESVFFDVDFLRSENLGSLICFYFPPCSSSTSLHSFVRSPLLLFSSLLQLHFSSSPPPLSPPLHSSCQPSPPQGQILSSTAAQVHPGQPRLHLQGGQGDLLSAAGWRWSTPPPPSSGSPRTRSRRRDRSPTTRAASSGWGSCPCRGEESCPLSTPAARGAEESSLETARSPESSSNRWVRGRTRDFPTCGKPGQRSEFVQNLQRSLDENLIESSFHCLELPSLILV